MSTSIPARVPTYVPSRLPAASKYGGAAAAPTPVYHTWNSSDKDAGITLSNGDLTATSGGVAWDGVRGTAVIPVDRKSYWEVTLVYNTNGFIGLGEAGVALTANPAADAYGVHLANNKRCDTSASAHGGTYTSGGVRVIPLAYDGATGKFWIGDQTGTWIGSGDPGAGTNETCVISNAVYLFYVGYWTNDYATLNCGADLTGTPFTYTVPSGFNSGLYS